MEEAGWDGLENRESFEWMRGDKMGLVVVNMNIKYGGGGVLSEVLSIRSELEELKGKRGMLREVIRVEGEGEVVGDGVIRFVCIDVKREKGLGVEGELGEKVEEMVK